MDTKAYIQEHNLFYRNGFRKLLTVAYVMTFLIFAFILLIFFLYAHRPVVKYFATTSNGQLIEIHPM